MKSRKSMADVFLIRWILYWFAEVCCVDHILKIKEKDLEVLENQLFEALESNC